MKSEEQKTKFSINHFSFYGKGNTNSFSSTRGENAEQVTDT